MGQEHVLFPQDSPNWTLVRRLLGDLQECLLNETVTADDTMVHMRVVYEAIQSPYALDQQWLQCQPRPTSQTAILQGARHKVDQSHIWFGLLQWLKKTGREEMERFLYATLPNVIELALRVEEQTPKARLFYSQQQKGGTALLSRQFVSSVLSCGFLCLFPHRAKDGTARIHRLNHINFTHFFTQLPLASQVSKLRCILHYFERTIEGGLERPGSITFHRRVANKRLLPSMEQLMKSDVALCCLLVHKDGAVEDVGSSALQVLSSSMSIGGKVLEAGNAQEEIWFSVCPELIASCLFMENMEDNEAVIVTGFEQFSQYSGSLETFQFAGAHYDKAERDTAGNLLNTMCAIDATCCKTGGRDQQYQDWSILRDLHKALVGFCRIRHQPAHSKGKGSSSSANGRKGRAVVSADISRMAEVMAKSLLSRGMVDAVRSCLDLGTRSTVAAEQLEDVSVLSASSDTVPRDRSSVTPRDEAGQAPQAPRSNRPTFGRHGSVGGSSSSSGGSNGERLSLPLVMPRGQNGSCDLMEVDYLEWIANFRRRSSQLSDLNSRRSSSSTKHSSDFSSDLEEIYETLVQSEKAEHGVIAEEEHYYGPALTEYAADFVNLLMTEGTFMAAQMLPGMKEFQQGRPPVGTLRPQVVRPALPFSGGNGSSDHDALSTFSRNLAGGHSFAGAELHQSQSWLEDGFSNETSKSNLAPPALLAFVDSLVVSAVRTGVSEAASAVLELDEEAISDDVYRWFADKIVQEVFNHVVDELYFQRFTSDSHWRATVPVNREGVLRGDQSDSESVSSSSSSNELRKGSWDMSASCAATASSAAEYPSCPDSTDPQNRRQSSDARAHCWNEQTWTESSDIQSSQKESRRGSSDKISPRKHEIGTVLLKTDSTGTKILSDITDSRRKGGAKTVRQLSLEVSKSKPTHTIVRQRSLDMPSGRPSMESQSATCPETRQKSVEPPSSRQRERGEPKLNTEARTCDLQTKKKTPMPKKDIEGSYRSKWGLSRTLSAEAGPRSDRENLKKNKTGNRALSLSSDSRGSAIKERREDRKYVTFTVSESRQPAKEETGKTAKVRSSIPKISHRYVPVPITKDMTGGSSMSQLGTETSRTKVISSRPSREVVSSESKGIVSFKSDWKESGCSKGSGSGVGSSESGTVERRKSSSSSSSSLSSSSSAAATTPFSSPSFTASTNSSIPRPAASAPSSRPPRHSSTVSPRAQIMPASCDKTLPTADLASRRRDFASVGGKTVGDATLTASERDPDKKGKETAPWSQPRHTEASNSPGRQMRASRREDRRWSLPSASTLFRPRSVYRQFSEPGTVSRGKSKSVVGTVEPSQLGSEEGAALSLTVADVNLGFYRAAAAIVNQVFQSLPQHLTPEELHCMQRGNGSSFYYQGRKYESIVPRSSYETAAAVIGSSEKGNVVSETFVQSKGTAGSRRMSSPRRLRSQSPSLSWLTNRLSRETLTNAFVKVESRHTVNSYERRSSEPCQRSVTLSLQNSFYGYDRDGKGRDDEPFKGKTKSSWRRGSLDSMAMSRRRSSCGFKDPVLSRFAQELILADTSVPQLVLMGSVSTSSTNGSRRSSMSCFRDATLATFESELLNSSFTLSQTTTSGSLNQRQPKRSLSHESHAWKSDSSEADLHCFPPHCRVGHEFQESWEAQQQRCSAENVHHYAELIANNIIQQAVATLCRDCKTPPTQKDLDIDIFSENLADQVLREALVTSAKQLTYVGTVSSCASYLNVPRRRSRHSARSKFSWESDVDYSRSSNDLTGRSLEDRLEDFRDLSDASGDNLETFAGELADMILATAMEDLTSTLQQLEPCGHAVATGNWGCGEFGGDPCIKMALQWLAASLVQCPQLRYFTYGDPRVKRMESVVELLQRQKWTVGQLMKAVRVYCNIVLGELHTSSSSACTRLTDPDVQWRTEAEGFILSRGVRVRMEAEGFSPSRGVRVRTEGEGFSPSRGVRRRIEEEGFIPSMSFFDFLLKQSQFL